MDFLDKAEIELECPRCGFYNSIFFRQARLRDVIICRGCKCNVRLDDQMNECRKARKQVFRSIGKLGEAMKGGTITIRL